MLYSKDLGALFLEVPKTGTVALSGALSGVCTQWRSLPRHVSANRARNALGPDQWSQLQTFAVIREPRPWLQSWYRYVVGIGRINADIDFETFVQHTAEERPIQGEKINVRSQFKRVSDGRMRRVIVSELLCFEYLQAEYDRVNESHLEGRGTMLGSANVSPRIPTKSSDAIDELIRSHWAKDYETWSVVHERARAASVEKSPAGSA